MIGRTRILSLDRMQTTAVHLLCKLAVVELRVRALRPQQLPVISFLNDISVLHDKDQVCVHDCGQPVGNDKACAVLHELSHSLPDLHLRPGVHAGGSLIKDQHCRITEHDPGDRKELTLPCGNIIRVSAKLYTVDRYPSDRFTFSSHGYDLHIDNELVADAFAGLSSQEQSILILHCVLELPDQEIGRLVGMSRSAVQRRRTKSLSELRIKLMALMPKGG